MKSMKPKHKMHDLNADLLLISSFSLLFQTTIKYPTALQCLTVYPLAFLSPTSLIVWVKGSRQHDIPHILNLFVTIKRCQNKEKFNHSS